MPHGKPTLNTDSRKNSLWIVLIIGLCAILFWLAFFWTPADLRQAHTPRQPAETPRGGDFRLQSPTGEVQLADYRGKVVILYFGYTFCPDICPTALSILGQALSALTAEEQEKVQSFFISIDPERDTLEILRVYPPFFHPNIVGLSGTPKQIAQVAALYGVRYIKQKPDAYGLYAVDHSAFTYINAPDGKLATILPHGSSAEAIIAAIRKLLDKPAQH